MKKLSTTDRIAIALGVPGVVIACFGMIAAWLAIPQVQNLFKPHAEPVNTVSPGSSLAIAKLQVGVFEDPRDDAMKVAEIPIGGTARILAKNEAGTWLFINFPEGEQTWISTAAVDITGSMEIPSFKAYSSRVAVKASPTPTSGVVVLPTQVPSHPPTHACTPSTVISGFTVRLAPEIPRVKSPVLRGSFFLNEVAIRSVLTGNEQICLASSPDGRAPISVEDQLVLKVFHSDESISEFTYDFYDSHMQGIVEIPPQDVSSLFTAGINTVRVVLVNNHPPYSSARPLYLTIWRPG